jgi:DNA-directed RNA polymerase subunit RPC12/RpoP
MTTMPTLTDLAESLLGDDSERYRYACNVCGTAFSSTERTVQTVVCPECRAHSVRERPGREVSNR